MSRPFDPKDTSDPAATQRRYYRAHSVAILAASKAQRDLLFPPTAESIARAESRERTGLTRRELSVVRAMVDPLLDGNAAIAYALHIAVGSLKVYQGRIYRKWGVTCVRLLVLRAMAFREQLGIELPTPEQFTGARGIAA